MAGASKVRRCHEGNAMLPGIRAVIAVSAAAVGLLTIAFVLVAALRVAQESRAASLHADLARGSRATPLPHRPVAIIETPAPTTIAALINAELKPEPVEEAPAPESPTVAALPLAEESAPPVLAARPAAPQDSSPPVMAFAPPQDDIAVPMPAPRPPGIGGPSPAEVAAAQAEHRIAHAPTRKTAAKRARKSRWARHLRARRMRLAAQAAEKREAALPETKSYGLFGVAPGNRQ
jgi:hypothetical protein